MRARSRHFDPAPPAKAESTLLVPDALVEWGRDPARVVTWSRDWAQEVAEAARVSAEAPLNENATERFLSRLEALVVEAIRAGRPDLLVGLDIQTAEWLGLQYSFETGAGEHVTMGRDGVFGWSEVRVLTEAFEHSKLAKRLREEGSGGEGWPEPDGLGRLAMKVLVVREEFPSAHISKAGPLSSYACVACGDTHGITRIEAAPEVFYCRGCWPAFKTEGSRPAWRPTEIESGDRPVDDDALADDEKVLWQWRAQKEIRDREKRIEDKKKKAEQQKAK